MTVAVQDLDIEHAAPVKDAEFNIPFRYWGDEHLRVRFKLDTDPVTYSADLAVDVDYSLDPAGLSYAGGTLTLLADVPADATHLAIAARTVRAQETALPAVAKHYEQALDRAMMILQEQGVEVDTFAEKFEGIDETAAAADASATAAAASATAAQTAEANAETAEGNAETAQAAAEAARDQVVGRIGNLGFKDTRAALAADAIDGSITHMMTGGDAAPGDGGMALWSRAGAEPAHAFKVQSADGAWWEGVPDTVGVSSEQFGAKGDDPGDGTGTDDTTAIQNAIDYATSQDVPVLLRKGKHYRVTNLAIEAETNLVLRSTGGMDPRGDTAATLVFTGAAGTTLLHLDGAEHATIEEISFIRYAAAAPDAYIKVTNAPTQISTSFDFHKVLVRGQDKTDASVGIDIGPGETVNSSDTHWGRVEVRKLGTGVRLNHAQSVGHHWGYFRGINCGVGIDVVAGGNLKIDTLNCTENDIDVRMRGGGANSATLTIDNAHVEWSEDAPAAVFLDVASDNIAPVTVVLNNPIVQNRYIGTFIKVGPSATVICNGGHLNGGDIDLSGGKDTGDALFLMLGGKYDGTFTANDYGYYEHRAPNLNPASNHDPFGSAFQTRAGQAIGFDRRKMKAAARNYTTMPTSRDGGTTVRRTFPTTALITGIEFVIETNAAVGTNDFGRFQVGGVNVAEIAIRDNGPRKLGWTANDLQVNDVDLVPLGDPTVTTAFAGQPEVDWKFHAGETAEFKSVTGHIIVEWIDTGVGLTGSDP